MEKRYNENIRKMLETGMIKKCGCGRLLGKKYKKCGVCQLEDNYKKYKHGIKNYLSKQ